MIYYFHFRMLLISLKNVMISCFCIFACISSTDIYLLSGIIDLKDNYAGGIDLLLD